MAKRTISLKEALLFWDNNGDSIAEEEEEDDIILNCQSLSKKPKWMTSPFTSTVNMVSDVNQSLPRTVRLRTVALGQETRLPPSLTLIFRTAPHGHLGHRGGYPPQSPSPPQTVIKIPIRKEKKTFRQRMNQEVKENDTNDVVEVIDLESSNQNSVESRPPLSNLAVRTKLRNLPTMSQPTQKSTPERKLNGIHPVSSSNTFTSQLRPSRTSTPKQTALSETFKIVDKMKYSQLLAEYHNLSRNTSTLQDVQQKRKNSSSISESSPKPGSSKGPEVVEVVDLTGDERKRTQVCAKPYQPPPKKDDDVKIIEENKFPHFNALERKLLQNRHVSPQWIIDMKKRYCEKEREMRRQVEEEQLKKELLAKHNETKFRATLEERIRRHLKITVEDIVLDDTEEAEPALPDLTPEMNELIDRALKPNPAGEGLVEGFGQKITRRDIQTLNKLNWLNDEVINFYMNLIIERGKEDKRMSVYAFNTFFYPRLVSTGYSALRRWTKKVDIFSHDLILVPIHLGMHWCMATIDFSAKTVRYYDSMGGENNRCLNALLKYLNEESMDKKKQPYDTTGWKLVNMKDIPQQMNGSDCGMFSCMFAEYASRNARISFSQKDMPYFRRKMVYEILTKKLLM